MMIDIILVTDKEIRRLNRRWFGRNCPTDVIAFPPIPPREWVFPLPRWNGGNGGNGGEVYISVDAARRQARERGVRLQDELLMLAVHGTAHIEGYDDMNIRDFCRMREREWELLQKCLNA